MVVRIKLLSLLECKGHTLLQLLQRVHYRMLTIHPHIITSVRDNIRTKLAVCCPQHNIPIIAYEMQFKTVTPACALLYDNEGVSK